MKKLISTLLTLCLFLGLCTTSFALESDTLTRCEFFLLIANTLKLKEAETPNLTFPDYDGSIPLINAMINQGYLLGRTNGTLALDEELSLSDVEFLLSRVDMTPKTVEVEVEVEVEKEVVKTENKYIPLPLPLPIPIPINIPEVVKIPVPIIVSTDSEEADEPEEPPVSPTEPTETDEEEHECLTEHDHLYQLVDGHYECVYCNALPAVGMNEIGTLDEISPDVWNSINESDEATGMFTGSLATFFCYEDFTDYIIGYQATCFDGQIDADHKIGFADLFRKYDGKECKVKFLYGVNPEDYMYYISAILVIEEVTE